MTFHFLACPTDVIVCVEVWKQADLMETFVRIHSVKGVASTECTLSGSSEIVP